MGSSKPRNLYDGFKPVVGLYVGTRYYSQLTTKQVLQNFHFASRRMFESLDRYFINSINTIADKLKLGEDDTFPDLSNYKLFKDDPELWEAHLNLKSIIRIYRKSKVCLEMEKLSAEFDSHIRKLPSDGWIYTERFIHGKSWPYIADKARIAYPENYEDALDQLCTKHAPELKQAGCETIEKQRDYLLTVYANFWVDRLKKRLKAFQRIKYEG